MIHMYITAFGDKKFIVPSKTSSKIYGFWASLVAQWLRICLPMQGTRVRSLVQKDPTCRRACN